MFRNFELRRKIAVFSFMSTDLFLSVSKKSIRGQNDYEMMKNMETLRVSLENENGGAEVAEILDEEFPGEKTQLKEGEVELKDDLLAQDDRSLPIKGGSVPGPHPQISDEGHTFIDSLISPEKELIKTSFYQVEQSDVICGFDETPLEGASPSRGHEETNGAETQEPCCNGVLDDQGMNHTNEKSKQTADCLEIEFVQFNADTNLADRVPVAGDTSLPKSPSRQITAKVCDSFIVFLSLSHSVVILMLGFHSADLV